MWLDWDIEWGNLQNVPAIKRNHPPPKIPFYVTPFLVAIRDLSGSRNNTEHGVNEIPFESIIFYAQAMCVEDVEHFVNTLQAVDALYVQTTNQKIKQMVENNG